MKQRDTKHLAIIASRFRHHYVELSRQKYSSNVVEMCLKIFDVVGRFVIVNELIWYPHFGDLVTDEYANYVISTALLTCRVLVSIMYCLHFSQYILYLQNTNLMGFSLVQDLQVPLRQILATAILSLENVNRRHPHCLKIFNILSRLGYIQ